MQAVAVRRTQPDLAQELYSQFGLDPSSVRLVGVRDSVSNLQPGDIVAWHGGDRPNGTYVGQMALYAGNGEIVEHYFGHTRRRQLRREDNTYGLPVYTQMRPAAGNSDGALSGPVPAGGGDGLPAVAPGAP